MGKNIYAENLYNYLKNEFVYGNIMPIKVASLFNEKNLIAMQLNEELAFNNGGDIYKLQSGDYFVIDTEWNIKMLKQNKFDTYYTKCNFDDYSNVVNALKYFKTINYTADEIYENFKKNDKCLAAKIDIINYINQMIVEGKLNKQYAEKYKNLIQSNMAMAYVNEEYLEYILKMQEMGKAEPYLVFPLIEEDEIEVEKENEDKKKKYLVVATEHDLNLFIEDTKISLLLRNFMERANSVDALTTEELIDLKGQLSNIPGVPVRASVGLVCMDKICEQIKQEVIEKNDIYGHDNVKENDFDDLIR